MLWSGRFALDRNQRAGPDRRFRVDLLESMTSGGVFGLARVDVLVVMRRKRPDRGGCVLVDERSAGVPGPDLPLPNVDQVNSGDGRGDDPDDRGISARTGRGLFPPDRRFSPRSGTSPTGWQADAEAAAAPTGGTWPQLYRQFGINPANATDKNIVQDFRAKAFRDLKKINAAPGLQSLRTWVTGAGSPQWRAEISDYPTAPQYP